MPITMPITMPTTPNRARWADIVDDSGDERVDAASKSCKKDEDEQMRDGEVSPAASFCSTQFSCSDELEYVQNAQPFGFDSTPCSDYSAFPNGWTESASLPPTVFAEFPLFPIKAVYPCNMPMQRAAQLGSQESQIVSQHPVGCFKKGRADPVKKRFLKKGSQDCMRRHVAVKQNTMELDFQVLPEASEEDWQRRLQKRHNIVAAVKDTPEYQAFAARCRGSLCRRTTLRTPSPNDRSVSKRQWEEKVQKWRHALRNWSPN